MGLIPTYETPATPIPNSRGLPIGLEQPLCGPTFVAQRSSQRATRKINPRGKSQLSPCQHKPRVQALIGWSPRRRCGRSSALLPVRGGSGPAPELTFCFADQPRLVENWTPCHHGHDQSASRISGRTRRQSLRCVVLRITVQECGQFHPRRMYDLSAENSASNVLCSRGAEFVRASTNAGAAGWVRKSQAVVNWRKWRFTSHARSTSEADIKRKGRHVRWCH
jgi:hypothetical protein